MARPPCKRPSGAHDAEKSALTDAHINPDTGLADYLNRFSEAVMLLDAVERSGIPRRFSGMGADELSGAL